MQLLMFPFSSAHLKRSVEKCIADQLLLELAGFRRWHPVLDQRPANVKAQAEDEAIERLVLPIPHHSEAGLLHDAAWWWAMLPGHGHLPNFGKWPAGGVAAKAELEVGGLRTERGFLNQKCA